ENVRPLTDRVRGALFNILMHKVDGSRFLDLYAGTGAVGIEALSRGAVSAIFVEINRTLAKLIKDNLALLDFAALAKVYEIDAAKAVNILSEKKEKFDIIFTGAPYDDPSLVIVMENLGKADLLDNSGVLVIEHRKQYDLPEEFGKYKRVRFDRYGETVLDFYKTKI
ncbi:MAG: 16S rRNA (guanine(966)-N(2))-methyltransferase RsmD, partial [Candidatus Margulisiibacteriota bacterium]